MKTPRLHTMLATVAITGLLAGSSARLHAATTSDQGLSISKGALSVADDTTDKHDCKGKNDCKGKGGCKSSENGCKGKNDCKGKGGCKTNAAS